MLNAMVFLEDESTQIVARNMVRDPFGGVESLGFQISNDIPRNRSCLFSGDALGRNHCVQKPSPLWCDKCISRNFYLTFLSSHSLQLPACCSPSAKLTEQKHQIYPTIMGSYGDYHDSIDQHVWRRVKKSAGTQFTLTCDGRIVC